MTPRNRRRVPWRSMVLLLAGTAVIALASIVVSQLRHDAVVSTQVEQRILDLRHQVTRSDAMAWNLDAQGFPNFTISQQLKVAFARAAADLVALSHAPAKQDDIGRIRGLLPVMQQDLSAEQRLLTQHRLSDANLEVLTGVDGVAQLLQSSLEDARSAFVARTATANAHLYEGTLVALGVSGLLIALLVAAAVAGGRRIQTAERVALERSERRFRTLVHRASEVVLVVDPDGVITYVSEAVHGLIGRSPEQVTGRYVIDLLQAAERPRARQMLERAIEVGTLDRPSEWVIERPDGSLASIEVQSENLVSDPDIRGVVLTVRDVTTRVQMEAQLRHQALHDPLTGLANRALFEDRVTQALQRAIRTGRSVGLIYLDIDRFKEVNDSLGHGVGDQLLRTVGERIDSALRASDTAARLGGDEFACLLEDLEQPGQARRIAERVHEALRPAAVIEGHAICPRASIGVADCRGGALAPDRLIRNADLAMYTAKESAADIVNFDDELLADARQRADLQEDLKGAVSRDELSLVYQPILTLDGGETVALEALLRWRHPRGHNVPPDRFIPVAEQTGLIVPIGSWVRQRALEDLVEFSRHRPGLRMNVNVSARELAEPDLAADVSSTLLACGVEPARLTLELTESEAIQGQEGADRLAELTGLGVEIAIDDFGTGQSTLALLPKLPVRYVKLDRAFLSTMRTGQDTIPILHSMIELGCSLGFQMVAEGIETREQLNVLRQHGGTLGQGYLLGRPQPAETIIRDLSGDGVKTPP